VRLDGSPGEARLTLPKRPVRIFAAPPNRPAEARPLDFSWDDEKSAAMFSFAEAGPVDLWVDPVVDITRPPAAGSLMIGDSAGSRTVALQAAWGEDGRVVYFAEISPREPGVYSFAGDGSTGPVEFLIQDRWEPAKTSRGMGPLEGTLREGSWIFAHVAPVGNACHFTAGLVRPYSHGQIDNLLRNGNFEEGSPGYPPRGWTIPDIKKDTLGWPEWSQKEAAEGKSSLRFHRDQDARTLVSQPMRLLRGGIYHLSFITRGEVSGASIRINGARGHEANVEIKPSPKKWTRQTAQVELAPGYTTVIIDFPKGPDADLWLDDIQFGKIHTP
jgi:hypothetical protein